VEALENRNKPTERGWTHPIRNVDECSMCLDCENECPTQSFNADTGLSDPQKCIECMRCVYICPDEVIAVDQRMEAAYDNFKESWHLTEEMMHAKQSKIITEPWQAAF
jgi:Fe-S-cluster-containing hydrogenase component 2